MMDDKNFAASFGAAMAAASRRSGYGHTYYYHTSDPDAVLSYSHYSDPNFDGHGAVIYGNDRAPATEGEYADRLGQWEPEKAAAAHEAMREKYGDKRCARRTEEWLSHYYGRPVRLVSIRAGTRPDNGYSWHFYRWNWSEEPSND